MASKKGVGSSKNGRDSESKLSLIHIFSEADLQNMKESTEDLER